MRYLVTKEIKSETQRMDADRNQSECICDRGRESEVWEINFIKIAD